MSTLLKPNQIEAKELIIENGTYHARLSTRDVDTQKGKKLIITHEIIEPVNDRETGEPVNQTIKLDRWLNYVEKDDEEVLDPGFLLPIQLIAKALGHTEEDGDFTTALMEGQVVKVKVDYDPGGTNKATGKSYSPSNQIKNWLPKDETFEEVQY